MKFREWVDASGGGLKLNPYTTRMEYWIRLVAMQNKHNPGWSLYLALESEEL
jgi:hypothetical protein